MKTLSFLENLDPMMIRLISIVSLIVFGFIAIKVIQYILRKTLKKGGHLDDAMHTFVLSAVRITCYIILIAAILQNLGVHMPTIVAVLGAMGAAIALALKDSLANVAGGVMIIFNHPFNKGDLITVGGDRGVVEQIDLFLTTLKTLDGKMVTIPNGVLNTSVIYNETGGEIRRVECRFGVSYESKLSDVRKVIAEVCKKSDLILDDPEPFIGVVEHADSAVIVEVLAYCKTADLLAAKYHLMEAVKVAFEENEIEIPYPHVEVNLNS